MVWSYRTTLEEMKKGWGWEKCFILTILERVVNFGCKEGMEKNEPYEMTFPFIGADGKYRLVPYPCISI
jgi:hypothetical protein